MIQRACLTCGKPLKKQKKYCSRLCERSHPSYKERMKSIAPKQTKLPREIRLCKHCKKPFEILISQTKDGRGQYCSRLCKHEHSKTMTGETAGHWKGGLTTLSCAYCKKPFRVKPSHVNKRKCCSKKCYWALQKSSISGSKNPHWLGGISFEPYCPKFTKEFKERVRVFFDHTCQCCGHVWKEGEQLLSVHHVNYKKEACCDENVARLFVTVCRKCHTKTNNKRDYWQEYFTNLINEKHGGKCYAP